jgi:integrase
MRKGELLGAKWSDVDLEHGTIMVDRTLLNGGRKPMFGPTKTGKVRVIELGDQTVKRLRDHKRAQAALKMANRSLYNDSNLLFAKEWGHVHGRQDSLGLPLQLQNFGQREFLV